jgi:glycosyltransferase involved in cell wall biosynthesis
MYRGVVDVATILDSPIVSFRDGSGSLPPACLGLQVTSIDCTKASKLARVFRLPRQLRDEADRAFAGAGVIVGHSLFRSHAMVIHEFSRKRHVPYVVVPHGSLEPALWRSQAWGRRAWMWAGGRRYLDDAAAVVFATEAERHHAAITLGKEPRSAVIPFHVDVAVSVPTPEERSQARSRLRLPADGRVFLVLGRLDPVKRPREILEAFCEANPEGCLLVFAGGDGGEQASVLATGLSAEQSARVFFLGHLDAAAKADALAASDLYLSWSAHESFGYAAAESMAAGLPVLLAPTHPLAAELKSVDCGILPAGSDQSCLVAAIRETSDWGDEAVQSRGQAARRWVAEHLGLAEIRARWSDLLARVTAV